MQNRKHFLSKQIKPVFASLLLAACAFSACSQSAKTMGLNSMKPVQIKIYDEELNEVNDLLFGQFMERHSDEPGPESALIPGTHRLQPKAMKLLEDMDIPIIRFPGGGSVEGSEGHWPDFIDNAPGREGPREKGNYFGYDEFLRTCETLGATPLLVTNFRKAVWKTLPLEDAAMLAAGLVAYANAPIGAELPEGMPDWPAIRALNGHPEPYNVPIFQIGNEWPVYTDNIAEIAGISGMRNQVAWTRACIDAFAEAMRAVDPDIELIIDAQVWDDQDAVFVDMLLGQEDLKETIQYAAIHFYRPWGVKDVFKNGREIKDSELRDEEVWRAMVSVPNINREGLSVFKERHYALALKHGWPVAMTEWNWNGWGVRNPVFSSRFARGIGAASFLNAMIRDGDTIRIGCQSMLLGSRWALTAIHVDPEAQKEPLMHPTGQMTAFYSQHHGSERLRLEISNANYFSQPLRMTNILPAEKVSTIDAVATANHETVFLHAINRDFQQPQAVSVRLKGMKIKGKATHRVVEGKLEAKTWEKKAWISDKPLETDRRGFTVELPPRSVSIIEIPVEKR